MKRSTQKIMYYLLMFFIFSLLGGILEILYSLIVREKLVIGGFMYGILRPIYGFGSLLLYEVPKRARKNIITAFLVSLLIGSIYEYISSYLLEVMFNKNWWNYKDFFLNINGRICLFSSFCWGFLGVIFYYFLEPLTKRLYEKLNKRKLQQTLQLVSIYYIIDTIISIIRYLPK